MKKYVAVFLLFWSFLSCEKENNEPVNNSSPWSPVINVEKGDGQATLYLINPLTFINFVGTVPSNPDYFEILISDDRQHFTLYKTVDDSTTHILIENLINEKVYYFTVTSHKNDSESKSCSDTLMTIPSEQLKAELLLPAADYSVKHVSASHDLGFISFNSTDYAVNLGNDMLYFKANASDEVNLIEKNAYNPDWSGTNNRLVYLTNKQVENAIYPFKMKLFDPETKIITTLFEIQYDQYYVINPTFSPDDETITFLSSKDNSEKYSYDLWKINPVTGEQTKITDFKASGFITESKFDWNASGEEIYLEGRFIRSSKNDIYKLNILSGQLTAIIESRWDERTPTLSPDNSRIAFISDRTGKDELWIYDFLNSKYSQITGESSNFFDSRYSNVQWLNKDQILITAFKDGKSTAVVFSLPLHPVIFIG